MSKSTTRGRQRGRRRNRPLRCEASTRMREWMCYRNHLVRRRGSAHDTSGRCPFHITKFSPGRSCWARESYSCPEYLMEKKYSTTLQAIYADALERYIARSKIIDTDHHWTRSIIILHFILDNAQDLSPLFSYVVWSLINHALTHCDKVT